MQDRNTQKLYAHRSRLFQIMRHGVIGGFMVNLALIILFGSAGIIPLALYSVCSLVFYAVLFWRIERLHVDLVVFLTFLEVLIHVPIVVMVLGWEGGFQYYLMVITPLVFIAAPRRPKISLCLSILLVLTFALLDYYCRRFGPGMAIEEGMLAYVRYTNIMVSFGLAGYVSWRYSQIMLRTERALASAANTDPLSGLSNRRYVSHLVRRTMDECAQAGQEIAFVLADIDDFKRINDEYGHETGDQVIMQVSEQLKSEVRVPDLVSRWGGEEFLLVLPDTSLENAQRVGERIRQAVRNKPVTLPEATLSVTLTFGVTAHQPGESLETCVDRADIALYRGKKKGKDRVEVWTEDDQTLDWPYPAQG